MRISRVGTLLAASMVGLLLGALVLPQAVGAQHFTGSSKTCTAPTGNSLTFQCVFTIQLNPGFAGVPELDSGAVVTVTQVGNAEYQSLSIISETCATGAPVITSPTTFTLTTTAQCVGGQSITVAETLKATGTGGGTECQNPNTPGNTPALSFCAPNFSVPAVVGPPKSADECKDGGFAKFNNPAFKNQGDCVSFVETGGRNPAAG